MAQIPSSQWRKYYKRQGDSAPPSKLLQYTWEHFSFERNSLAVDLGSGRGRDTHFLLQKGMKVLAVDSQRGALRHLRQATPKDHRIRLKTLERSFEKIRYKDLPLGEASLVLAAQSLYFCNQSAFPLVWRKMKTLVHPGGVLAVNLLGTRDGWAKGRGYSSFSAKEVVSLLREFSSYEVYEIEQDAPTMLGEEKHWHFFEVVGER